MTVERVIGGHAISIQPCWGEQATGVLHIILRIAGAGLGALGKSGSDEELTMSHLGSVLLAAGSQLEKGELQLLQTTLLEKTTFDGELILRAHKAGHVSPAIMLRALWEAVQVTYDGFFDGLGAMPALEEVK